MRRVVCVEKGGMGETRSSRHSRIGPVVLPLVLGCLDCLGPEVVMVAMEDGEAGSVGGTWTSWKA